LYRPGYLPSEVKTVTVYVPGTRYYVYENSWNIVSVPLIVTNRLKSVLFRTAVSSAFAYGFPNGYVSRDTLQHGVGYMVKFNGQQSVPISGIPKTRDTVDLQPQWNLIGSISVPVPVTTIRQTPPGIVQSLFFGYNGGYEAVDTLEPGRGYWVKAGGAGNLILSEAAPSLNRGVPNISLVLAEAASITFSDLSGAKQILYFTSESLEENLLASFELPPPAPEGIFSARFVTNRMLEHVQKGKVREIPIQMSSVQYPLTIDWGINGQPLTTSLLIGSEELPISGEGATTISGGPSRIVLKVVGQSLLPQEFALLQNYPNPFNPSTTIRYSLPNRSQVMLKIYDILGREVKTLVDELQEPGNRFVVWNSTNSHGQTVGSGVYLYQLHAGSYSSVKKMLLLK
jgi:hypothetical protein